MGNNFKNDQKFNRDGMGRGNLYNRPENKTRNADRRAVDRDMQTARANRERQNNVFADNDGNVARRDGDKWQSRADGSWCDNADLNKELTTEQRDRAARERSRPTLNRSSGGTRGGAGGDGMRRR